MASTWPERCRPMRPRVTACTRIIACCSSSSRRPRRCAANTPGSPYTSSSSVCQTRRARRAASARRASSSSPSPAAGQIDAGSSHDRRPPLGGEGEPPMRLPLGHGSALAGRRGGVDTDSRPAAAATPAEGGSAERGRPTRSGLPTGKSSSVERDARMGDPPLAAARVPDRSGSASAAAEAGRPRRARGALAASCAGDGSNLSSDRGRLSRLPAQDMAVRMWRDASCIRPMSSKRWLCNSARPGGIERGVSQRCECTSNQWRSNGSCSNGSGKKTAASDSPTSVAVCRSSEKTSSMWRVASGGGLAPVGASRTRVPALSPSAEAVAARSSACLASAAPKLGASPTLPRAAGDQAAHAARADRCAATPPAAPDHHLAVQPVGAAHRAARSAGSAARPHGAAPSRRRLGGSEHESASSIQPAHTERARSVSRCSYHGGERGGGDVGTVERVTRSAARRRASQGVKDGHRAPPGESGGAAAPLGLPSREPWGRRKGGEVGVAHAREGADAVGGGRRSERSAISSP
eukprot:scaffold154539_cov24-Tisochrysis_lutea.AAC.2